MKTVDKICHDFIKDRLDMISEISNSARGCVKEGDYFQAAVRLGMIADQTKIDSTLMEVLESVSSKNSKYTGDVA